MLQKLIKELVLLELDSILLERRRPQPQIMYHGTSSNFLSKIFQSGLIPDPSEGKWKNDELEQNATISAPSLRSLEGSYWTDNVITAASAGRATAKAKGGERAIVIAQIIPQSAKADEDDVRIPVERAFRTVLLPHWGHRDISGVIWPLLGAIEADPSFYKQIVEDFSKTLHDDLKSSDKMPLDKTLMKLVFDATLERMLGHINASEGREKWSYIESYERQLENIMPWEKAKEKAKEKAEKNDIPKFDKVAGERNFLSALDKLSSRYRKSALPPQDEEAWRLRTNLRVTQPIGFTGRNKIIAIVVGNDKNFEVVYGNLPSKFIDDWSTNWGPEFKITDRRTGKVLHNSLED